ncbi:poly(A) polymerase [Campylobacter sp. TTU-622]|uniref:poly(A) polymerase n=1 Tax=Campylobacter sp. TTU-622 TaxID=2800583 RepID=UPI001906E213|nr:poly(A) polymerase [Campylobacter sp. TTU-622]MBK1972596.1 poly(A) polymerase [Campylobacter sp. TTU-622]
MQNLEKQRVFLIKRLGILKFLSILEAFLIGFLSFIFIKDLLIALILAIFTGIFFFRFISKKLKKNQKELELNILKLFLCRFGAKLKQIGINQKEFEALALSEKLEEIKSFNTFKFNDFTIYDLQFIDERKRYFCGILIKFSKINKEIRFDNEEIIYNKLKDKFFNIKFCFGKEKNYLISTLTHPFFIDFNHSVEDNLKNLEKNLQMIKNKFLN